MKNRFYLLLISMLMIVTACRNDDDFGSAQELTPVPFKVLVKFDASAGGKVAANAAVTHTNTATGENLTGTTDANGELSLTQVLPGQYNIISNITLTSAQYYEIFGITTTRNEIAFNGSQNGVTVNVKVSSTTIMLSNGTVGDFVIKQYYYAGSDTSTGALFRDQFVEIHNNSNQTLYADGLYIALLEGNTNSNVATFTQPNGQLDWSLSPNNTIGSSANTDYVYASSVIKIPGSGTDYPIEPGKSFIIAQTGINHKAPYTSNTGTNVEILDPSKTVDLSGAEFETYLGNWALANGESPYIYDIQNPAVKDVDIAYWSGVSKDWLLNVTSRPAIVFFKDVATDVFNAYPKIASPKDLAGKLYLRIPKNVIMDGVDTTNRTLTAPKDLQDDIYAGRAYIKNEAGEAYADYSSYSVIRKTKEVIGSRTVLVDTNNSTNDFTTIKANPKAYAP